MAFIQTTVVVLALAVLGHAQYLSAPLAEPSRDYAFGYQVADPITGDVKSQSEVKQAGVVQGEYSFIQPDGSLRQVTYAAAPGTGFNAVVKTIPGAAPPNEPIVKAAVAPAAYPAIARAAYPAAAYPAAAYPYTTAAYPYHHGAYPYAYSAYPYAAYPGYNRFY
uniref:Cuticular protein n=1 Tax=Nilaparvata lugens TaxID=108931 RepID=A0A2S1ZSB4_NILLU|nr:cuticular protein [Nilaparvata lugens]